MSLCLTTPIHMVSITSHVEHIQTQKPRYSQFCYWACSVNANWLQSGWWLGARCLYNANFRIRVLTITEISASGVKIIILNNDPIPPLPPNPRFLSRGFMYRVISQECNQRVTAGLYTIFTLQVPLANLDSLAEITALQRTAELTTTNSLFLHHVLEKLSRWRMLLHWSQNS